MPLPPMPQTTPPALRRAADTTLTEQLAGALRRAHPPAPAGARRAAAVGARVRAPPRRQPAHGGRRLRPAAGAGAGRGATPARLLRARAARAGSAARARRAGARRRRRRRPLPISATSLIRGMFQPPGAPADARPGHAAGRLARPAAAAPARCAGRSGAAARRAGAAVRRAGRRPAPARRAGAEAGRPRRRARRPSRSSPRSARPTRSTSSRARCCSAGDACWSTSPAGRSSTRGWRALGMRVLPVPRGDDGPDLAAMQRADRGADAHERPRLYVTVSVLHNPTGASLSLQSAHRVLQLAQAHDLHIVEDDTYAHLAPAHLPRLARARRAAAHDLRLRLLEDPGAELAGRLPRRAAGAGRPARRHQAAVDADDARR